MWALRRTKLLWVGMALTVPLVISLTNLTCYYYSLFMVAGALVLARPQIGPALLVTSGVSQIMLYAPYGYYWVDDRFTAQSWLFYAMGILLLFAYSRPFSMERLKAWWNHKPEPKGKGLLPPTAMLPGTRRPDPVP
jgi:cell division protein FtsW (lipid II flippase)